MDKLIKKDKKKMDKMMNTLIKKDIPRDKKIEKCDMKMKKKKKTHILLMTPKKNILQCLMKIEKDGIE